MSENEPFVFLLYYLAPNYMVDQDHMVFFADQFFWKTNS